MHLSDCSVPDTINGAFEFLGGVLLWVNVIALYRDKKYAGVRLLPTAFFSLWGIWNLYYYPSLHQWLSFVGGVNIVTANLFWVFLMVLYRDKK